MNTIKELKDYLSQFNENAIVRFEIENSDNSCVMTKTITDNKNKSKVTELIFRVTDIF